MDSIKTFRGANDFLIAQIPSFEKRKFPGQLGLDRTKYLMKLLGNPQEKLKIVHIAGTSGKGSTAYLTSILLKEHGFKVGLTTSPHLVDIRERIKVNGMPISEEEFVECLNVILPKFYELQKSEYGSPTYFEVIQAMSFLTFAKEQVDYAVIETGLGGALDASNVVEKPSKTCLITRIGLDHTKILGNTLELIAAQKAGIIQEGNTIVTIAQAEAAQKVIEKISKAKKGSLTTVTTPKNFRIIKTGKDGIIFDFSFERLILLGLFLSMPGSYQAENAALALTALVKLSKKNNFQVNERNIRQAFAKTYFPGRFDIRKIRGKIVVIDGAHNPQKMSAFLASLKKTLPGQKYDFVIAFKKNKDWENMLKQLIPFAKNIYATSFLVKSDMKENISEEAVTIKNALARLGFQNSHEIKEPENAFNKAVSASGKSPVVVTGSLYLCGEIYKSLEKTVKKK